METIDGSVTKENEGIYFSNSMKSYVGTASKWTVLTAICLALFCAAGVFTGIRSLVAAVQLGNIDNPLIFISKLSAFTYLIFGAALIIPIIALVRFTMSAKKAIKYNEQGEMDFALKNMKTIFVFFAIYLILIILAFASIAYLTYEEAKSAVSAFQH